MSLSVRKELSFKQKDRPYFDRPGKVSLTEFFAQFTQPTIYRAFSNATGRNE
jgi:hypothetical protein